MTETQMSGAKLVSIVTPVYNAEAYLKETLDSILHSDYQNIEVILMDDGSTDGSVAIAKQYAEKDRRVKVYQQANKGPCAARNHAISLAQGTYILPVDADDLISPTFISQAVEAIEKDTEVKAVCPRAEFFGDRKLKRHVLNVQNRRYFVFFERELGGPLRYNRSWSRLINSIHRILFSVKTAVSADFSDMADFVKFLPQTFCREGETIYKGRNELKAFHLQQTEVVVKSYQIPHLLNRIIYRWFRKSKACRSYLYAQMLQKLGIGTPAPIGYCTTGNLLFIGRSFFACRKSECPYTYRHFATQKFPRQEEILCAIAQTTAKLHENGILHKDYSAGNILFDDRAEEIKIEIIDLNRIRFRRVDMEAGCRNFERLPGTPEMLRTMAYEYARCRGMNAEESFRLIQKYRQE